MNKIFPFQRQMPTKDQKDEYDSLMRKYAKMGFLDIWQACDLIDSEPDIELGVLKMGGIFDYYGRVRYTHKFQETTLYIYVSRHPRFKQSVVGFSNTDSYVPLFHTDSKFLRLIKSIVSEHMCVVYETYCIRGTSFVAQSYEFIFNQIYGPLYKKILKVYNKRKDRYLASF